jgi:hypothetical protein
MLDALLPHQDNVPPDMKMPQDYRVLFEAAGDHACCTGSFAPTDRGGYQGRVHATAINVLTLETYYRLASAFAKEPR